MPTGVRVTARRRFGQFLVTRPAVVDVDGRKYRGPASIEVDVAPDQEVALLYRSPWLVTMKGSLKVQ